MVWDGPSILTLKARLASKYPGLGDFFSRHLLVQTAPPSIVADELKQFAATHRGSALSAETQDTLFKLLDYGAVTLKWVQDGKCDDWTKGVIDLDIFPVRAPDTNSVSLSSRTQAFFLPDGSGILEGLFKQHVAFLAVSPHRTMLLRPLFEQFDLLTKQIDKHVSTDSHVAGEPTAHDERTTQFSSRIPYLHRYELYTQGCTVTHVSQAPTFQTSSSQYHPLP